MPPFHRRGKNLTRTMDQAMDKEAIRGRALDLGFDAVGFVRADDPGFDVLPNRLRSFLKFGYHGDMDWMAKRRDRREHPKSLWPDANSIVVLGKNYGPDGDPAESRSRSNQGTISCYAQGADYHDPIKKRLKQLARWMIEQSGTGTEVKVFVDTAPILEKPVAERAGIGWQGKHTNLVSRRFGSWLFLSEILTTLVIEPDRPETDHCGSCDACLRACPTDAFPEPYVLDARRCISYLTIEHKGAIAPELMAKMGNHVYGCDDCLAACPWTKFSEPHAEPKFRPRPETENPNLEELAQLDDTAFRERFQGSPIKRTGRERFARNVAIAMANSGDVSNRPVLEKLRNNESPLVRETAAWAIDRLSGNAGQRST